MGINMFEGARRIAKLIAAIAVLAVVSSSAAAEWVTVGGNESSTVYADPVSIRKAGNRVKMWYLIDFKAIQNIDGVAPYISSKDQSEYDCLESTIRTLYYSNHTGNMGAGDTSFTSNEPSKLRPIPPGSIVEALWKYACGKK